MLRRLSTTAFRRNQKSNGLEPLTKMLHETDETQRAAAVPPPETIRTVEKYKTFKPNTFIRPWDLSLEGRSLTERFSRRPAIPPRTRDARKQDIFYNLGLDPLKLALHPKVLSPYMSEMAMIQPRRTTLLTSKSQRRIAKAIRRAKMMGVIPLHSRARD